MSARAKKAKDSSRKTVRSGERHSLQVFARGGRGLSVGSTAFSGHPRKERAETRAARERSRGVSLAETIVSVAIMAIVFVAALRTLEATLRSQQTIHDGQMASFLTQDLLGEIMTQRYLEPFEAVVFGREVSEQGGPRAQFDDVDDYHGWVESPPVDQNGAPLEGYTGWSREVEVTWVDPSDLNSPSGTDKGLKRIVVTALFDGQEVASAVATRTQSWVHPWEETTLD
jgi:hypothetical protein